MTTHRSGNTQSQRPAPPRTAGEMPYTALRQKQPRTESLLKQRLRRVTHILTLVLVPVVLLSLAAAGIVYVRLLHGPVSLKAFGDSIEHSINAQLDGFTTAIDDAVLTLAEDYTVELRLINLRVSERDGDLVASAPTAAVELNKSALWRLEAAPERVFLIEPSLAIAYSEAQGFQLSIADAPIASETSGEIVPPRPVPARAPSAASQPSFHRIDIARILAESSARARNDSIRSSAIREVGVRNATVTVSYNGKTSQINVPEASVDLEHMKRRSIISGNATIASDEKPWTIAFRTDESTRGNSLKITTTVRDLVPSAVAKLVPGLDLLAVLSTPLSGEMALDLSNSGDLKTANLEVDLGHGFIGLPSMAATPILIDGGHIGLNYDAETRRLNLTPSTLHWGRSNISLAGVVAGDGGTGNDQQWQFQIQSTSGVLEADEFSLPPIPIDSFKATGRLIPSEGFVQLAEFSLKAGGAEVSANGEIIASGEKPSTRLEASLSPMPITTLKALWPRAASPTAREWVGTQVERASLTSASLKLLSGRFLESEGGDTSHGERLSARMEVSDLRMQPLPESLPMEAPQATIRIENSSLEVIIPQAAIIATETTRLPLSSGRFTVVDFSHDAPIAELALKSQAPLAALIETLNHSQLHLTGQGPLPIDGINGKVDGELTIAMPLVTGGGIVKAEGKARISDVKGRSKEHKLELQGGTIDIAVADGGVIAKGDMIVNSVPTKLYMNRIFDALPEMQPPIRISAKLDNSDRTQLGLDVNYMVQGVVPVEVAITQRTDQPAAIHVRADLTDAELMLTELAWKKPSGRSATLEFDVDAKDPKRVALTNYRVIGDNIAIDGSMILDEKHEVSEFSFPNFSLNVVSRLAIAGKIDSNRVWKMNAKGSTFDAKNVFRSLLSLGNTSDTAIKPLNPAKGVDITAEIGTLIGHADVSLREYKATMSERGGRMTAIDATGVLDGGKILVVQMKGGNGSRKLTAETADAGQAFKLVGFYPNLQGGRLTLEVDLEGRGAAETSGKLWVDNFRVLGDPIISEVFSSAESGSETKRKREVQREVFEFQRLTAPFSVGHGQFVLDDSYIRGPLLGASIRGKVDYNTRQLNLGGTYVPLQGINSAVCDIPLVGPIVAGFDCQGVFGITYAIEGSMAQPQVLVNPLSMFTPGILRVIMEMTNPNPKVQPMSGTAPRSTEKRARASTADDGGSGIDGWSSETKSEKGKKK